METRDNPQKFLVTRDRDAISWFARSGQRAQKIEMDEFDVNVVQPGYIVIGTLSPHLAAAVCARGGRYWHLTIDAPSAHRDRSQSAEDKGAIHARLEEFHLRSLGPRRSHTVGVEDANGPPDAPARPVCHVCVATDAVLANLLPARQLPWDQVVVLTTPTMAAQSDLLALLLTREAELRGLSAPESRVRTVPMADLPSTIAMRAEMVRVLGELQQTYPRHEFIVNATGGTKPIYTALTEEFRPYGKLLYCNLEYDQVEYLWPPLQEQVDLDADLVDLETLLSAQNTRIVGQAPTDRVAVKGMQRRQRATASLALGPLHADPADAHFVSALHGLASFAKEDAANGAQPHPSGSGIGPVKPFTLSAWGVAVVGELVQLGLLLEVAPGTPKHAYRVADATAATYLSGGYLEEFAYLSAFDLDLPKGYVGMNVQVSSLIASFGNPSKLRLNEMDVAITWRNRLLVIECKAGRQLFLPHAEPQNIANKIGALKVEKAGRFGSAWLLSRLRLDPQWNAAVMERLTQKNVELLSGYDDLRELPQRLRQWCGLPSKAGALDWTHFRIT